MELIIGKKGEMQKVKEDMRCQSTIEKCPVRLSIDTLKSSHFEVLPDHSQENRGFDAFFS